MSIFCYKFKNLVKMDKIGYNYRITSLQNYELGYELHKTTK